MNIYTLKNFGKSVSDEHCCDMLTILLYKWYLQTLWQCTNAVIIIIIIIIKPAPSQLLVGTEMPTARDHNRAMMGGLSRTGLLGIPPSPLPTLPDVPPTVLIGIYCLRPVDDFGLFIQLS